MNTFRPTDHSQALQEPVPDVDKFWEMLKEAGHLTTATQMMSKRDATMVKVWADLMPGVPMPTCRIHANKSHETDESFVESDETFMEAMRRRHRELLQKNNRVIKQL